METKDEKAGTGPQAAAGSGDPPSAPPEARPGSLDLEALLKPISRDSPSGEFLRYTTVYDRIQDARREDDAGLPQGVWERDLKKADWPGVRDLCLAVLIKQTKDIQIAAWLMEALLQLHGFAGVREGLRLLLGLCRNFWESIFPLLAEDDWDDRLSPFIWINEKLSVKLKFRFITNPTSVEAHPYTYADWERVTALDKLSAAETEAAEKDEKKVTRSRFLGSVMFSSRSFYAAQNQDLQDCLTLLTELEDFLKEKCGPEYPTLGRFREILTEIRRLTRKFLSEKDNNKPGPEDAPSDELWEKDDSGQAGDDPRKASSFLSIRNRAEAYRMLDEAADYLLIHEPHSPTPYLVKRAVSWGHMTFNELLQELVTDNQNLAQILALLGLKKPDRS